MSMTTETVVIKGRHLGVRGVLLLVTLAIGLVFGSSRPVGESYTFKFANPTKNHSISLVTWNICVAGNKNARYPLDEFPLNFNQNALVNTKACNQAMLREINKRHLAEGFSPIVLPLSYGRLSPAMQVLVIVNAERTSRGLPPYVGVTTALMSDSLIGAKSGKDPNPSNADGNWIQFNSIWAGSYQNVLMADYDWMYNDGWAGSSNNTINIDCHSPSGRGCWGHREGILANYPVISNSELVAGAAVVTNGPSSLATPSIAAAFEEIQGPIRIAKALPNP
ncbi:hypothetical protein AXFE_29170 [Acidithrix ferrooxidans]|uniref:Uncharacterized protein n=2 Tax=Acidithrix ferrooxidans TaxID=1280514 RepID=A0A0D8HE64_9ACTN|nr:hypothetical protein AXFE_29170 [Acidithrix ferrooxidans]